MGKIVEIECLACGKSFEPRELNDTENYDTDNYDGQIRCQECNSLLQVKTVKGKVQKCKVVENKFRETLDPSLVIEFRKLMDQKNQEPTEKEREL